MIFFLSIKPFLNFILEQFLTYEYNVSELLSLTSKCVFKKNYVIKLLTNQLNIEYLHPFFQFVKKKLGFAYLNAFE